jgi:hypothetical protein
LALKGITQCQVANKIARDRCRTAPARYLGIIKQVVEQGEFNGLYVHFFLIVFLMGDNIYSLKLLAISL